MSWFSKKRTSSPAAVVADPALEELLRESPDLRRTVRLAVEDLWQLAEPALNAHVPVKTAGVAALEGRASERQLLMWRLAAEEIRTIVTDGLAARGEVRR